MKEGEIFGFLGPNGAGKTTTLLMLLGSSQATSGSAEICGLNPPKKAKDIQSGGHHVKWSDDCRRIHRISGKGKFGVGAREYSLEEVYMKYFQEV